MHTLLPHEAEIVDKWHEAREIFTFRFRFKDRNIRHSFRFRPGQFNMIYLFGSGEIPISIVSDPDDPECFDHTVRIVGNVTGVMATLEKGDVVGIRGPYGSSWPLEEARGKDVIIATGGLGCAPVVSVINYITQRRRDYGALKILHGVKTPKDLLYQERFRAWRAYPNTEVYLTSDEAGRGWHYSVGMVTNLFNMIHIDNQKSILMMCGPEVMMHYAVRDLRSRGVAMDRLYVSMERNMQCALGFCGHCQYGPMFVCKDGPIFRYDRIEPFFGIREL